MPELVLPSYQYAIEALRPNERRGDESGYDRIDPKPEAEELAEAMAGLTHRIGHVAVSHTVVEEAGEKEYWKVFQPHLTPEELSTLPESGYGLPRWTGSSWQIPCDSRSYNLGVVHGYFRPPRGWRSAKNYRLALAERYRGLAEKITDQSQGSIWTPSWSYFSDRSLEAKRVPDAFQRDSLEAAVKLGADIERRGDAYYSLGDMSICACLPGNRPEHERRKIRKRDRKDSELVESVSVDAAKLITYVLGKADDSRSLWFDDGVGREAEELARLATRMKYRPSQEDSQRIVDHAATIWKLLQLHQWEHSALLRTG